MFRAGTNRSNQFAWFDRSGQQAASVGRPGNYRTPSLSPDGKRLVYTETTQGDLWILEMDRQQISLDGKYLFTLRASVFNARNSYIPSADGSRFLVNTILETEDIPMSIVQHWTTDLKR
jgi:Tol biopolymer transport system component